MSAGRSVKITVELTEDEAWLLAQLCKRIGYYDCKEKCALEEEPYTMLHAMDRVGAALSDVGYAPR